MAKDRERRAGMASTDESQAQRGEVQGPPAGTASTGSSQAQSGEVQGPPAADGTTEGGKSADEGCHQAGQWHSCDIL